jgi:hypothetical protein
MPKGIIIMHDLVMDCGKTIGSLAHGRLWRESGGKCTLVLPQCAEGEWSV